MKHFKRILIIFPKDSSTQFLAPLCDHLTSINSHNVVLRLGDSDQSLVIPEGTDLVVFLGHGASNMLYGSPDVKGERLKLLSLEQGAVFFKEQSVILLSCDSSKYLKTLKKKVPIKSYFGFGDMPTDWEHIVFQRELEANFMLGIEEFHLDFYRTALVESVMFGFLLAKSERHSHDLYVGIKIQINKKINEVLLSTSWSRKSKLTLINMLVDFKDELEYY